VGASAVERSQTEHELSELERLGEVVVGAQSEPGGFVVGAVGCSEHEDGHAAAGSDDASGDLVAGGSGMSRSRTVMSYALTLSSPSAVSPSPARSAAMASRRRPSRIASAV
jgi:hypothetical protein